MVNTDATLPDVVAIKGEWLAIVELDATKADLEKYLTQRQSSSFIHQ